jgi:hypothetical protein
LLPGPDAQTIDQKVQSECKVEGLQLDVDQVVKNCDGKESGREP